MCVICLNLHNSKYTIICKLKYPQNMQQYAVPNMQKICTNTQIRNIQNICIISPKNMHKYAFYVQICVLYAWSCIRVNVPLYASEIMKCAGNMQYQICRNMHKYANKKNALNVHNKPKYAKICKTKFAHICKNTTCRNMHQACTNMQIRNMHKYAFYMQMYAWYARICKRVKMSLCAN